MASDRSRNFQIYGIPLLTIVAAMTVIPTLLNTFREIPLDFTVFMMSARWLRAGQDPYRELLILHAPNANPPAFMLLMVPLTFINERIVFALWTAAGVVALLFSLEKIGRSLNLPFKYLLLVVAGLQGVSATLRFGQVSLLLLPLMTLAWLADRENRKRAAGGWLGALIYLKPFFGLYAIYMVWRREWTLLRSLVVVFLAMAAAGLIAGIDVSISWIQTLRTITEKTSHVANASWPALVSRVFTIDRSQPDPAYSAWVVAPALATALSIGGAAVIALISAAAVRRTPDRDRQWAILAVAMLLISPLGWMYYIPLLIPPLAAALPSVRSLVPIILAGALLWVPSSPLARNTFGPLATATIASPYSWGLLLLWASLCWDALRSRKQS